MNAETLRVLIAFDGSSSAMAVARCWSSWESERVSLEASLLTITPDHAASAGNAAACPPLADKLTTAKAWFSQAGLALESVVVDGEKPAKSDYRRSSASQGGPDCDGNPRAVATSRIAARLRCGRGCQSQSDTHLADGAECRNACPTRPGSPVACRH